mgnify:CR=1 FL=1
MVREYSLRRDGDLQLSPHFRLSEFASKDGSDKVLVDDALVDLLQQIRAAAGAAVTINSAYRSPAHNAAVGGVSSSQHLYGRAADIVVEGASPLLVGQMAEHYLDRRGGIGVYQTFTHVDTRTIRSRWDQRSGHQVVVGGWSGWEAEEVKTYRTLAEVPASYQPTIRKLMEAGALKGTGQGEINIDETYCRVMTTLDRLGLLEVK